MNLLIMRHAEAEPLGGAIQADADRPLTPQGQVDAHSVGTQIKEKSLKVEAVVSSPLTRCLQTAVIVGHALGLPEVYPNAILGPYGIIPDIGPILDNYKDQTVLLVGHHPDMGLLATSMITPEIVFTPATLIYFAWDAINHRWRYAGVIRPFQRN